MKLISSNWLQKKDAKKTKHIRIAFLNIQLFSGDNSPGRSRGDDGTKNLWQQKEAASRLLSYSAPDRPAKSSLHCLFPTDSGDVQRQKGRRKRCGHAVLADKAVSGQALRRELKRRG